MNIFNLRAYALGLVVGGCISVPAVAEDIEIYTTSNLVSGSVQPNVLFILDSSGSMNTVVQSRSPYDYNTTYAGCYDNTVLYYTPNGSTPGCGSARYFFKTANTCDNAKQFYESGVVTDPVGPLLKAGFYTDNIAQFLSTKKNWRAIKSNTAAERNYLVECRKDSGVHGVNAAATETYIKDGGAGWTATVPADPQTPHPVWTGGANSNTIFDGNYLNYLTDNSVVVSSDTRFNIARDAIEAIVLANNNINIGLMRYDSASSEGGSVSYPILDINAARNDFLSNLKAMKAGGATPLSETYFEALLYFGGKEAVYGDAASPSNQAGTKESVDPTFYQTPITEACQKNYIVYLSDGNPVRDYLDAAKRSSLTGFAAGACNEVEDPFDSNQDVFSSDTSVNDNCLDDMAAWALKGDDAERAITAHDGNQTITSYMIGFDFDNASLEFQYAEQIMRDAASKGGGKFYEANSKDSLLGVFNSIIAEVLKVNATFSSPAVSVNAFNRATNLDDLYFTLFKPADGAHWDGNLKKFKLDFEADAADSDGDGNVTELIPFIADKNGNPAIDPDTGFFLTDSTSFWTDTADAPDGNEAKKGGAASRLTLSRNAYTFTGTYTNVSGVLVPSSGAIAVSTNELRSSNAAITDAMLGGVAANPAIDVYVGGILTPTPYRDALLGWAYGYDILDIDNNRESVQARRIIGDPLHSEPALVQYGELATDSDGDGRNDPDLVSYVATNDGYLHAIDAQDGHEIFSFIPQELLPNLNNIFDDSGVNGKSYGLDGNVVAWINDKDRDGKIEAADGEHVYLYVGMRRGGSDVYAFDVTTRTNPVLLWKIQGGTGDFAEMGQSWSTINVGKLRLNGADTQVLVFGGGYDPDQDTATLRTIDDRGRGIFIVDASSGRKLWRAGPDALADDRLANMKYSIPARVKPLDVNGDGYIDRLYAGDMGGQLWRFDIEASETISDVAAFTTGGLIADLALDASTSDARRFYYPPDVALIAQEGKAPFLSIVATSGYRAHPLNTAIQDRAYMIRDTDVYVKRTDYTAGNVVHESDLYDTTDNLIGGDGTAAEQTAAVATLSSKDGWLISLEQLDGSFVGEKGLAEPLILNGSAIFTTYIPASAGLITSVCTPNAGNGLLYFVNVSDGTPTYNLAGTVGEGKRVDRTSLLQVSGIPPSPSVIVTDKGDSLCVGTECGSAGLGTTVTKSYWYELEQ